MHVLKNSISQRKPLSTQAALELEIHVSRYSCSLSWSQCPYTCIREHAVNKCE